MARRREKAEATAARARFRPGSSAAFSDGFTAAKSGAAPVSTARAIWRCSSKYRGERECETPDLTDDEIRTAFPSAMVELFSGSGALLADCAFMREALTDTAEINGERERIV